jgi:hypothetical protein
VGDARAYRTRKVAASLESLLPHCIREGVSTLCEFFYPENEQPHNARFNEGFALTSSMRARRFTFALGLSKASCQGARTYQRDIRQRGITLDQWVWFAWLVPPFPQRLKSRVQPARLAGRLDIALAAPFRRSWRRAWPAQGSRTREPQALVQAEMESRARFFFEREQAAGFPDQPFAQRQDVYGAPWQYQSPDPSWLAH